VGLVVAPLHLLQLQKETTKQWSPRGRCYCCCRLCRQLLMAAAAAAGVVRTQLALQPLQHHLRLLLVMLHLMLLMGHSLLHCHLLGYCPSY
jgi:hypothetical protein